MPFIKQSFSMFWWDQLMLGWLVFAVICMIFTNLWQIRFSTECRLYCFLQCFLNISSANVEPFSMQLLVMLVFVICLQHFQGFFMPRAWQFMEWYENVRFVYVLQCFWCMCDKTIAFYNVFAHAQLKTRTTIYCANHVLCQPMYCAAFYCARPL